MRSWTEPQLKENQSPSDCFLQVTFSSLLQPSRMRTVCSVQIVNLYCCISGYDLTPTMRDVNKKFSVRYFLNLVLVDEEDRRYFKQQVTTCMSMS